MKLELQLSMGTFSLAVSSLVAGIFGAPCRRDLVNAHACTVALCRHEPAIALGDAAVRFLSRVVDGARWVCSDVFIAVQGRQEVEIVVIVQETSTQSYDKRHK
jgi:hypothetical protein